MSRKNPYCNDFTLALEQARKAMSKGNLAQANQWTRLAERHVAMSARISKMLDRENPMKTSIY